VIRSLAGLLIANACYFAAGAGVVRLFGFRLRSYLGVAYLAGVAAVGVLATLMLIAGLALSTWEALLLCAILAATGLVPRRRLETATRKTDRRLLLATTSLLGLYLTALFAESLFRPLDSFDGWLKWTMKARALVLLNGLDPAVFANDAYRALVMDYPMLIPSIEAIDFHLMGGFNMRVIHVQFWLFLVGFLVAVYDLLRDRVQQSLLCPALLLVGAAPALAAQDLRALADAPLAFFFALAVLSGWRYVAGGGRRWLALAALMAGAALATKPEGAPFVFGLFVLLFVASRLRLLPLLPVAVAGLASLVAIVPWRIWVAAHSIPSLTPIKHGLEPSYLADHADRVGPTTRSLLSHGFDSHWHWALPLALGAVTLGLWARRSRGASLYAAGAMVVVFISLVWGYWVQRETIGSLLRFSANRVVTTLVVVAGVLVPVVAAELTRPGASKSPARPDTEGMMGESDAGALKESVAHYH
jgi:hypothetical protein